MANSDYKTIVKDGLWDNNGVFSMLLGMCPAMAMTTSATNGFGMGLATAVVMAASSWLVAVFRNQITTEVRIPVYILIVAAMVTVVDLGMNAWMHELYKVLGLFIPVYILIVAAMVTVVDLGMNAWMHELYKVLGLFIPLIVSNCLPLARLEAFAAKQPPFPAFLDGLFMGLGFTIALTAVGAVREIIGSGTLFADASLLLGPSFKVIEMRLLPSDMGVLMMILPPGGFMVTGMLVVVKRLLDLRAGKEIQMTGAHAV